LTTEELVYVDPSELVPIITLIVDVATNSPVKVVAYVVGPRVLDTRAET
jgi:hypothetical protein